MLNRRHIRVKVMQSLYAMQKMEQPNLDKEEKFLHQSIGQMYDLYLLELQLLVKVHAFAKAYMDISQKKHLATEAERNPNQKFINNRVLNYFQDNQLLQQELKKRKLKNWELDDEYVDILYHEMVAGSVYQEYMESETDSFKEDRAFVIDLFKQVIAPNEKLYDYLEDQKITWVDDLPLVNTTIVKKLGKLKPASPEGAVLINLYKDEDDEQFTKNLFLRAAQSRESLTQEVITRTPNWDKDRIAEIDLVLITMALCEFQKFPEIPVKASINEYLEIAKEYSTPKSSIFINGILDRMKREYKKEGKLNKTGRGLIE
ncbi:transcription antitermination protein NusB [Croceiramulus getboli]|nr:transcription antitermination protein NusB [Flavobacteriaceae bacterium YJPT1-3]